jgi:hypothetical protein
VAVPRRISPDGEAFIAATANRRPAALGRPLTRWSLRKLVEFLAANPHRVVVVVGREWPRQLLPKHQITFRRTKTWKEPPTPTGTNLARIEYVIDHFPHRVFAFDEFGPLARTVPNPALQVTGGLTRHAAQRYSLTSPPSTRLRRIGRLRSISVPG